MEQSTADMIEESGLNKGPNEIYEQYAQNTKKPPVSNSLKWRLVRWLKRRAAIRALGKEYDPQRTLTRKQRDAIHQKISMSTPEAVCWGIQTLCAAFGVFGTGTLAIVSRIVFTICFVIYVLIMTSETKQVIPVLRRQMCFPFVFAERALTSFFEEDCRRPDARLENEECSVDLEPMHTVVKDYYAASLTALELSNIRRQKTTSGIYERNLSVLRRQRSHEENRETEYKQCNDTSLLLRAQERLRSIKEAIAATENARDARSETYNDDVQLDELEQLLYSLHEHIKMDEDEGRPSEERKTAQDAVNAWLDRLRARIRMRYESDEQIPVLMDTREESIKDYTPALQRITDQITNTLNTPLPHTEES